MRLRDLSIRQTPSIRLTRAIVFFPVCLFVFAGPVGAELCVAVRGTAEVDGHVDASWSNSVPIRINRPVVKATPIDPSTAAVAEVRVMWDAQRLYFLLDVLDNHVQAKADKPWEQDSIELFLDEGMDRATAYDSNDSQLRVSCANGISGVGSIDQRSVRHATQGTDTGYRVELSIAPSSAQLKAGVQIGFEAQVNDDPGIGARRAVMKWHQADDRSWKDTSKFGTLVLVDQWSGDKSSNLDPPSTSTESDVKDEMAQDDTPQSKPFLDVDHRVPDWAADAVYYQIFPERFRRGDSENDPTRSSLEAPSAVPENWEVTRWTSAWYARSIWEQELGDDFYENGVFHRRYGGDLQGIIQQLGYLSELGINTIYLNPVFYARSLHKYDGNSYHHIDPYFGPAPQADLEIMASETSDPATWQWTAADRLFLQLIKQAHAAGIRIIIDGVFNHTGRDFFAFADLRANQQKSPYVDWYVVESFDDPNTPNNEFRYGCWWGVTTLPEFANSEDGKDLHAGPKQYILDATKRWMDPDQDGDPSDGIDGWRLDVAAELPDGFWVDWHKQVRQINPQALTVAEHWEEASEYLERCGFSSAMNYHGFAFLVKGFLIDGSLSPTQFVKEFAERSGKHPSRVRYALQNLIDSHDTDRVASMIVNARPDQYLEPDRFDYDVSRRCSARADKDYQVRKPHAQERELQRMVATVQMTFVGAPMLYYGTEAGMWGGDDPDDRKPMVWDDLVYDDETGDPRTATMLRTGEGGQSAESSTDEVNQELPAKSLAANRVERVDKVEFDRDLFEFYRNLIKVRHDHPSLRRGQFRVLAANDNDQTLVYLRQYEQDNLMVTINRSNVPQRVTIRLLDQRIPSRWQLALESGPDAVHWTRSQSEEDGVEILSLTLAPRTAGVLEAVAH